MTVAREARYLSGAILGKTITYWVGESHIQGLLYDLNHTANLIEEATYADLSAGRTDNRASSCRCCPAAKPYTTGSARTRSSATPASRKDLIITAAH